MKDFKKLFDSFLSLKVGVIGDVMLDTYMWGHVDRISPEAPVPVVTVENKEYRVGGAGNVALNCRSLGASVSMLSVTGDDSEGIILRELFESNNIDISYLIKSAVRKTTSKTRVISRNQQMLRLDAELTDDLSEQEEILFLEKIQDYIAAVDPDVIIFEDYNKGVLTSNIINKVIALCNATGIITAVDPKRKNFFSYKGVNIFKPNLKEVRESLNLIFDEPDPSLLKNIHNEIKNNIQHQISLITLSDKGIFYQQDDNASIIPSHLRNISDVSGAGDTVIAVASLVFAASKSTHLMAEMANIAGGLVCEEVGTVAINKERLLQECELLLS